MVLHVRVSNPLNIRNWSQVDSALCSTAGVHPQAAEQGSGLWCSVLNKAPAYGVLC